MYTVAIYILSMYKNEVIIVNYVIIDFICVCMT